jgi:uncharacterized protein YaiI (UPF0178 family)
VLIIYIDADACPVKDEVYRVAERYQMRVAVVAKSTMQTPANDRTEMVVRSGFGEVDDWIAEQAGVGDIVITTDIPLAARCLTKNALVLHPKGEPFTESDIGSALAHREILEQMRQSGIRTGGPAPMAAKDRSRFLSKLDEMVNAVKRALARTS